MSNKLIPHDISSFKVALSEKTLNEYVNQWGNSKENLRRFCISSYVNKALINYCHSRNIKFKDCSILEFGCRNGSSFLAWLYMECKKIVGIDKNEKAIYLSKLIFQDLGHNNIEYRINKRYDRLPISTEEFDIVSCNAILEHLPFSQRTFYIDELSRSVTAVGTLTTSLETAKPSMRSWITGTPKVMAIIARERRIWRNSFFIR